MKTRFAALLVCFLLAAVPAFAKSGTLLVAFGTSMESARPAIDGIEQSYTQRKDGPVLLAFTSDIIRNKLAREGKPVLSVNAAMHEMAKLGVTDLRIQSLHIAPAEEYSQLERMVVKNITKNPGTFKTVKVGYPLLVSEKDLDDVVKVVLASLPADRKPGDAVVLMGHGNDRGDVPRGTEPRPPRPPPSTRPIPTSGWRPSKAPTASTTSCRSSRLPGPSACSSSPS